MLVCHVRFAACGFPLLFQICGIPSLNRSFCIRCKNDGNNGEALHSYFLSFFFQAFAIVVVLYDGLI